MTTQPGASLYTQGFGTRPESVEVPFYASRPPTTGDIKFPIGKNWIDQVGNAVYTLTSLSTIGGITSATWSTSSNSSALNTLTGNTGGAISPSAGNINIVGSATTSVAGSGNTLTISSSSNGFPITPFVVGPSGQAGYQTIQAAINAAHAAGGGAVYVQQGTYTENLTFFDQVNLVGVPAISQGVNQGTLIIGTHTPPNSGHIQINGICLASTTHVFSSTAAGSTHIQTANCESAVENGYLFNLPNWTGIIEIYDCNPQTSGAPWAINDGGVNNSGGSNVIVYNSGVGSGTNVMTVSGSGCFFGQAVSVGCPLNLVTGANVTSVGSQYLGTVTLSNNSVIYSTNDSFITGSSPAITMSSSGNSVIGNAVIDSTNSPAITGSGSGTLKMGNITFINNTNIANTLTMTTGETRGGNFITQFVVGKAPDAHYQTIQAAVNAANAAGGGMVWIQPGTYTENLTLFSGIQLSSPSEQSVTIIGTHTPPSSGTLNVDRMTLQSATNIFSSSAAGTTAIIVEDCTVNVTNGYTFNLPNWTSAGSVAVFNIGNFGTNDGFFNNTAGCQFYAFAAGIGNGSGNTLTCSGITIFANQILVGCPVNLATGAQFSSYGSTYTQNVTYASNQLCTFQGDTFITGSSAALTHSGTASLEVTRATINSSHNPAISGSGAGQLNLGDVTFLNNAAISNSLSVSWFPTDVGSLQVTGNLTLGALGNKIIIPTGSNASVGTSAAMSGTPGAVTVATTASSATAKIFFSRATTGGTPGQVSITAQDGTGFTLTSTANETSTFNWWIINA